LAILTMPTIAVAQATTSAALVHAEGDVFLNERIVEPGAPSAILPETAVVRTSRGRAVIALKRGGFLFLDDGASVSVHGNGVYNFNRIEVLTGSAIVASETSAPLVQCESEIRLSDAGVFRFDVQLVSAGKPCRIRVFEGAAAVPLVTVVNALRAGQAMSCDRRCGDMIPTTDFSRDQLDDFDRWAAQMVGRLKK